MRLHIAVIALVVADSRRHPSDRARVRLPPFIPSPPWRDLLVAEGHDDAVVVLGVLQIVLGQHRIAGRRRIAGERHVLLGDMRGRAADLYVRARALEAARERALPLAVAVTSAAPAVLLSLPHWLRSRSLMK